MMKSEEQIRERINKLKKRLSLTIKHHDKYVELYNKSLKGWRLKDLFYIRPSKYKNKYIELYYVWREMIYYKKGLEWTLQAESEQP